MVKVVEESFVEVIESAGWVACWIKLAHRRDIEERFGLFRQGRRIGHSVSRGSHRRFVSVGVEVGLVVSDNHSGGKDI